MNNVDKREHTRTSIPNQYKGGSFHISAGDERLHFVHANDISVSGMGISCTKELEPGTEVKLTFISPEWRTDVYAHVVWCHPHDANSQKQHYRSGMAFHSHHQENNAMLYLAVREDVDPYIYS